jgi:hypothetical protein
VNLYVANFRFLSSATTRKMGSERSETPDGKPPLQRRKSAVQQMASGTADMTRRVVCGGLAGMIAKTATAPLERIKMLSQTGEHGLGTGKGGVGFMALYRNIIKNEGVLGLWAGNGANMLRVFPAKGIVFSSNDFYKRKLFQLVAPPGVDLSTKDVPGWVSFFGGGLAGMSATAVTYPLDFARGRITGKLKQKQTAATVVKEGAKASATPPPQNVYKGIINTVLITSKEEGVRALWQGITPTLLGVIPYEGIKFGTVGLMEQWFPYNERKEDGSAKKPPLWRKLCFGGMGGVMAGLLTYPNDTVRRMLQLQGSRGTSEVYTGYFDCVRKTYAKRGIQRFYNGVFINLIRMGPNTAVQFGAYDMLTRLTEGIL